MLPWGHAAVGYLSYRLYTRLRYRERPREAAVVALAVGTQFPDLVDKPLAWTFGILPSGRSLAHSLLLLGIVVGVLYWFTRRSGRSGTELTALAVGWSSHLLADGYSILFGEPTCLDYLVWPFRGTCPYEETNRSIIGHMLGLETGDGLWFGLGLTLVATAVWLHDGAPGLRWVRDRIVETLT
jgi:membrane-bound metal-dependent hydrolase YbcI (DUF457 family)